MESVARRRWLAGQVIALPHHAPDAFDWGDQRLIPLLHRRRIQHKRCAVRTLAEAGVAISVAITVWDAAEQHAPGLPHLGEAPLAVPRLRRFPPDR